MSGIRSFSRRTLLRGTALTVAVTAAGLSQTVSAQEKVSKAVAKYQDQPKGQQRCAICINFEPPKSCRFVAGDISPQGWCQFFAARDNAH